MKPSILLETTRKALLLGGAILEKGAKRINRVEFKSPLNPVTEVDRAAEKAIVKFIRERFPDHNFLGEESASLNYEVALTSQKGKYRWIIDPLDGTVNFIHRIPQSCVSIAVECGGDLLAGGIYDPFRRELFLAGKGLGATLNGRKIKVSTNHAIKDILAVTGFPYNRNEVATRLIGKVESFLKAGIDIRRFGSAALDLAWLACGRIDIYWETGLCPWDVAAGILLVQEAGGKVTDFQGKFLNLDNSSETFATNGLLHKKVMHHVAKEPA